MQPTYSRPGASSAQQADTLTDTFDTFLRRLKNGLFGVLFIVNKEEHGSHWIWAALESLVDHFQDLSLLFGFSPFAWQKEVEWLHLMFEIFSPEKFVQNSEPLYIFLISIIGLVLINTLWVGYSFSKNRFRFIWTLKFLRFTLGLFATILYIPILERFVHSIVRCQQTSMVASHSGSTETVDDWAVCWQGQYLFKSVATTIVSVIFIANTSSSISLVLAVGATFFDFDPKLKDIESRPHSRMETLYVACRTVLIILSIVLETYGDPTSLLNKAIFAATSVVASGLLAFSYIWYIPYYSFNFAVFRAALQLNFFWCSLCTVFTLFRPYSDIGILFILLSPVALLLASLLIRARRRAIEHLDPENVDALTLELMVRFRLEAAGLLYKESPKTNITLLSASPGDLGAAGSDGGHRPGASSAAADQAVLESIINLFTVALRANPHSCLLHIFAGQFYLLRLGNKAQCIASLTKAENMEPKVDEASMIFRRQRLLNERFSGGDVIDFIAYEQNMALARKYERRAEAAVVQFWAELLHRNPSFRRLHHHGAALTTAISNAQQHYTQVLKLSPNSPHGYRMYAGFLINILNDHKQGQELVERADELEGEARRSAERLDDDISEEHDDGLSGSAGVAGWADNALVTISGEAEDLGTIINVNPAWLKLFGYKKHEILHQNIDRIVPSPFSEVHDALLQRYLDTGNAKVIDRPRQVLGVHADSYLFPVTLCVKQLTSSEGRISFLGIMSKPRAKVNEEFMIVDASYALLHSTQMLVNAFGKFVRGLPVASWIPGLDFGEVVKAGKNFRFEAEKNGKAYSLTIAGDRVALGDLECYICRVKLTEGHAHGQPGLPLNHPPVVVVGSDDAPPGVCPMGYGRQPDRGPLSSDGKRGQSVELAPNRDGPSSITQSTSSLNSSAGALPMVFSPQGSQLDVHTDTPPTTGGETLQLKRRLSHPQSNFSDRQHDADDDDDHRSQASSITRSGSSSTYIKNVIALKNVQTNRQLKYLRLAFIVCLLILGVLSVTENTRYKQLYSGVVDGLVKVQRRGDACLQVVEVVDRVRTVQIKEGAGAGIDEGIANATEARADLETNIATLLSVSSDFATLIPGTVPYAEILVYTPLLGSSSSNYTTTTPTTLFDALSDTVTKLRYILNTSITADPQGRLSAMNSIYVNGPNAILKGLNASAADASAEFREGVQNMRGTQLGRSAIGPGLCLLVFLVMIWPLYVKIHSNRQRFFQMFLDIPKEVVKGIYSSHLQRLAEVEEDEEDLDVTDAGNRFALEKLLQDEEHGLAGGGGVGGAGGDVKALLPSRGADHHHYRKSGFNIRAISHFQDPHRMIPKVAIVFLLCVAYFFSAGGIVFTWLTTHNHVADNVYWSLQVPVLVRLADYRLREELLLAYGYMDEGSRATFGVVDGNLPDTAASLLTKLATVERALMYGDAGMQTTPAVGSGSDDQLASVMLDDACINGVPDDCQTFLNGVLTQGLHASLNRYTQLGRDILSLLATAGAAPSTFTTLPANLTVRLTDFRALSQQYLPVPLTVTSTIPISAAQSHAAWFDTFHLTFTIVFCLALAILYAFLFRPLLVALSEDNRRTHVMLYMIPPEILSKVESIRQWAEVPGSRRTEEKQRSETKQVVDSKGKEETVNKVAKTVEIV
ncbi:hypothetical protein HK104_009631 [Borealophlyctis nickersoniae]|nr:hypothetical protein HK104_009631 [Borealophlyctis nickersoniae]